MTIPSFSRGQMVRDASLTAADLAEVDKCRRDHNRLGFAYQVGFVRLFSRFPAQQPLEICDELLSFVAMQLNIDATGIDGYAARQHTVSDHQARIRGYLKLVAFDLEQAEALERFVFEESCRLEPTAPLLARAREFLKQRRVLFPAESALLRLVGEQRKRAHEHIVAKLAGGLPPGVVKALDGLLEVKQGEAISGLQAIKANPAKPSPTAMQGLADKLAAIEATGVLAVDLSWLNANYQRALFHYVRKCSADRLREVARPRRLAALACFLRQSYCDAVDQAVDMFDKLLTRTHTRAEHELDDQMRRQRRTIKEALTALRSLGAIILDDSIGDAALRPRLFAVVPREELEAQVAGLTEWVTGTKSDVFHGLIRRFSHLRQFSPVLLRALEFCPDAGDGDVPCLEALRVLKEMNAELKRKLPEDAPTDFIPKRLLSLVVTDGKPDRKAWECALLLKLQDDLRSGNLSVKHSKRFGRFEDYFLPTERWEPLRKSFFQRSGLPADPQDVPDHLTTRLNAAYDLFLKTAPDNSYAAADEHGWHLSTDAAEALDAAAQTRLGDLKRWLTQQMRTTRLPDLLIEADNDLRFTDQFLPPARRGGRDAEDVCTLLAVVLAHGCNLGLHTMAQLTQGVTYKQIKRVSDWQMTEEAQRAALATLVHAISRLDTTLHWGEGRTSASDGQRFALPRKVLQQTYSTRFSDFALEFYSFVADNYAPFYSTPIECTDRDAAFVLDGLLYNESDLELEEHYTDTHGYTEINFAAFAMLGRRFCPRIRGLQKQRLYRLDVGRDYGPLSGLVGRADRTIDPWVIAEQWDRMGQFYASLENGHTTASVALKRLASCTAKNRFYRANRDLGRVFKTEFLLSYLSEPQLRSRIRRGLLKVEQLHALARDVYYGRRGRINARELQEQMNSCSCLKLILACVIYWQAKEISRVVQWCQPEDETIDVALLEHVSPIEWDNVIVYGQYVLDRAQVR
ncbi:MAG: Tn3 family transposase [Planctomycetaceae bacterium]|nr:Tn3 family transposase [Planctomycetaceae bacterium]